MTSCQDCEIINKVERIHIVLLDFTLKISSYVKIEDLEGYWTDIRYSASHPPY